MRKVNSAVRVKVNMPHIAANIYYSITNVCCNKTTYTLPVFDWTVDEVVLCGLIINTYSRMISGGRGATQEKQQSFQSPSRRGHAEFGAGESPRPEVPGKRVLRSRGCRASKIRDAASGFGRKGIGYGCCRTIRHHKTHVLPDSGKLRRSGSCGTCTQEERPSGSPQTRCKGFRVFREARKTRGAHSGAGIGQNGSREVRSQNPSENDRASTRVKKNIQMKAGAENKCDPAILTRYEVLRRAATGEPLQPEDRGGLALFLRRGMWSWAKALTIENVQILDSLSSSSCSKVSHENRAIIQVFAAMATTSNNGRAQ